MQYFKLVLIACCIRSHRWTNIGLIHLIFWITKGEKMDNKKKFY